MKVLSISSDRRLFEEDSAVSERIKEYAEMVEEYHVVVFALKSLELKPKQLGQNIWIYPTNSWSRWFYVFDAARIGKKIVFDRKFVRGESVITTQDPFESGWTGLKIKKRWRLPLEVQIHTDPNSPYFSGFLNYIRKIIARTVLAKADSVRDVKTLPIYVDKEKIENAPIKFDLHALYPWHFILLAVSRLSKEKNLDLAIQILSLVREKYPDTGLVIVGSGPEESRLKNLVKKMGLETAVYFAGWQNELASFYKTANAFIQTSLFEGYGLSLVEAGLSGLPVVTTPVGIAQELENGKDAYIYPASRPDLFALGIIELIESNQKRENLRFNLKKTLESKLLSKEQYLSKLKENWENTAKKIK
ncbi:MAG: glycosyltransferase [Candidatus Zambryskibacteria bacterium]|nr:glycosyltransferase [Candidatus Zambryskibacteria bacterium]